ncbi:iron ABC transporter permease [Persicirhabdus sediminis]|uniref:Iron ABC transporter permease n=1 Tax=Persicirhabdus sediminis TaxID=454144 RepID=A0A8J7MFX5_9BACT|nr:iron ABC transporter permease [Persicirhabdus sediminis]
MVRNRLMLVQLGLLVLSLACLLIAPMLGADFLPWSALADETGRADDQYILKELRLPRVLMAYLCGGGLAICGMVFQAMFRNPLATPFTLGVASGASLGVAIYVWSGVSLVVLGFSGLSIAAMLGALLAIALVYLLTQTQRGFRTSSMLLAGVAISFFFSSVILFIQYMSSMVDSVRIMRWLMGGLDVAGYDAVLSLLPFVLSGAAIMFYFSHDLNLVCSGEELAVARGVDVKKVKLVLFFTTSLLVGAIVSVCGPVGFVGMMVPHICRHLVGADHRGLLPASMMFGGIFLVACDVLARSLIAPAEMPVGILTAMLGGPFFVILLVRAGR